MIKIPNQNGYTKSIHIPSPFKEKVKRNQSKLQSHSAKKYSLVDHSKTRENCKILKLITKLKF